jgi:hypothetical protein
MQRSAPAGGAHSLGSAVLRPLPSVNSTRQPHALVAQPLDLQQVRPLGAARLGYPPGIAHSRARTRAYARFAHPCARAATRGRTRRQAHAHERKPAPYTNMRSHCRPHKSTLQHTQATSDCNPTRRKHARNRNRVVEPQCCGVVAAGCDGVPCRRTQSVTVEAAGRMVGLTPHRHLAMGQGPPFPHLHRGLVAKRPCRKGSAAPPWSQRQRKAHAELYHIRH